MSVGQALRDATTRLATSQSDSPLREARWLLGHALGQSITWLTVHGSDVLEPPAMSVVDSMLARRLTGEPLSYVLGEAEFYGRRFAVDRRVLVPRPETEELLERAIDFTRQSRLLSDRPIHVVDVGTGSGILAVSLALEFPVASVTGCDLSEAALDVARLNVHRYQLGGRVSLVRSNLLGAIESPIDLLIANLPYVRTDAFPTLQVEVLREPTLALDGGEDGFELYRRLFEQVRAMAKQPVGMFFEIGSNQGAIAGGAATTSFPGSSVEIFRDLAGRDRFVVVTR